MSPKEPINRKVNDAGIATVILIAAMYFGENMKNSLCFVRSTGLMPNMLSKSRFNRRMHRTGELLSELFLYTGETVKSLSISHTYAIDNFPVAVCHNIRIARNRILKDKVCWGYCVSKRCYFYGFKVHVVVTADGIPVEYTFTAGSTHDPDGFKQLPLNFSESSEILADSAYSDYSMEKMLDDNGICLHAARKGKPRRPHHQYLEYLYLYAKKTDRNRFLRYYQTVH